MSGFAFADPLWLSALPAVLAIVWLAERRAGRHAVQWSSTALFAGLPVTFAQRLRPLLPWLVALGCALLVTALARPRQGREEFRVRSEGIAIELVIDRSGSMAALDFELDGEPADRLTVVKDVVADFVRGADGLPGRPDDAIGLVAFGGWPESRCPLTLDHDALLDVLAEIELPGADLGPLERRRFAEFLDREGATAIGDALTLGVERLRDAAAKSRVVVLLSDGADNASAIPPLEAAEVARAAGVKVYTIGVGSTGLVPVRTVDSAGRPRLARMRVDLDETTLQEIARITGGAYYSARDAEALRAVYADIDRLEKTRTEGAVYTDWRELFEWALLPGAALLLLERILRATRFRTLP